MTTIEDLRPHVRKHIFDLVQETGFDMGDWIASSKATQGPKANPKYCYAWSFVQPDKLIVLNLWHDHLIEDGGHILQRHNFKEDARHNKLELKNSIWARRATAVDSSLQTALRNNLPVRVVINDGRLRDKHAADVTPSKVSARELDAKPWTITRYDWETGEVELTRGIVEGLYIDQFDLDQKEKSETERRDRSGSVFVRDPQVRRAVLLRAKGYCEFCGEKGFPVSGKSVYLETHHIVPLSEQGEDIVQNVAALCANDHRRAHHGLDKDTIRTTLLEKMARIQR